MRNCKITMDVVSGKAAMTELAIQHNLSSQRVSQLVSETLLKVGMKGIPYTEINLTELGYRLRQHSGLIHGMFDKDTPEGFYYNELYGRHDGY